MPSVNLYVEADVACWTSGIAAGGGNHLPVGYYGGAVYRSAMRFPIPAWAGWTSISSATLTFYISDHNHVGAAGGTHYVSRQNVGSLWTKGAGGADCDADGFTGGNNTQNSDIPSTSTDRASFLCGVTPNASKTVTVTGAVNYYRNNGASKMVFVFEASGSGEYTELWAMDKSGYDAVLTINYVDASPPNAPTLGAPAAGNVEVGTTPTFSWTHSDVQGNPQTNAEVRVYDAAGTTLLYTWPVAGAAASLVAPVALTRGTTYQWEARTQDATGWGPYATKRSFSIKALPVVVVENVRRMEYANGAPRLRVNWTADQPQTQYRVQTTTPTSDTGWVVSTVQSLLLSAVALTNGTATGVTVTVRNADGAPGPLEGSGSRSFTPRWGLTVHRRDLTAAPNGWGTPAIDSIVPTDANLVIEYGSNTTAAAAPTAWFSSLGAVPLARYVYWRAWFLPSATLGPTLNSIDIPTDETVSLVDKWGTTKDTPGLVAPWSMVGSEYVYGTRSIKASVSGAGPFYCYAYGVKVKPGRNYILTGLMKSVGNSGACIELQKADGSVPTGGGMSLPAGPMRTDVLTGDKEWYTPDQRDVNRYRTPVWVADAEETVYVVLKVGGTAGAQAWFDAIKLEESTVATPWSPAAVGATVVDAGGVQIDGEKGGILRYRGTNGGLRSVVEGGPSGLLFAGDTELTSPSDGVLAVDGVPIPMVAPVNVPLLRYYPLNPNVSGLSATGITATTAVLHSPTITAIPANAVAVALEVIGQHTTVSAGNRYEVFDYHASGAGTLRAQGFAAKVGAHYEALSSHWVALGGDRQFDYKVTVVTAGTSVMLVYVYGYWAYEDSSGIAVATATSVGKGSVFPVSPAVGDVFYHTVYHDWFEWNGSAWLDGSRNAPPGWFYQSGYAQPGTGSGNASAQMTVTFPIPFSAVPVVMLTTVNFNWFAGLAGARPTNTSFTFATYRPVGGGVGAACECGWLAYGPR